MTRIFALRFFQEWIWHNAQDSIELRSQFSFGLDAFGSTINESLAQVNQVVPNNRFFSWQGQAQRYSIHPLHSPELRALRRIEHDYPDTQYVSSLSAKRLYQLGQSVRS